MSKSVYDYKPKPGEEPLTIKLRVDSGCFHRECSPAAYSLIDQEFSQIPVDERNFSFIEHESGPEIIAWIALGTASLSLASSIINFVTAIINSRSKGHDAGDRSGGKLKLIIRDTLRTESSTEEFVMEIYDRELVSSKQVKEAIEKGMQKRKQKH